MEVELEPQEKQAPSPTPSLNAQAESINTDAWKAALDRVTKACVVVK